MALVPSETARKWTQKKVDVLDHGFVRLVDFMGSDDRVVQAARVSFGAGTKTPEEDKALIDYLMRNGHTSPFEQVVTTWHVKMPIFVARQWIRHRTARVNEVSGRYSQLTDDKFLPLPSALRRQSKTNKQGRGAEPYSDEEAEEIVSAMRDSLETSSATYRALIEKHDLALELARIPLPVAQYTEMYWQMDLHNLFHFLRLRLDSHAQAEIRAYGEAMAPIVSELFPWCWEAFVEHSLCAVKLSKTEAEAVREALTNLVELKARLREFGIDHNTANCLDAINSCDPFLALSENSSNGHKLAKKLADVMGMSHVQFAVFPAPIGKKPE